MDPVISTTSRYSDRILDRRKELFPSKSQQADSDDDWNNIKPFSNESSLDGTLLQESENYYLAIDSIDNDIIYTNTTSIDLQNQPDIDTNISDLKCINSNLANSLGNYSSDEIIYDSEDSNLSLPGNNLIFPMSHHSNLLSTPHMDKEFAFSEMSPLCVSPMTNGSSKSPYQMKTTVSDIRSPSEKLKTPSESFSTNSAVPKLMRKSVGDGSFSDSDNRDKNPKVRTALFKDKLKNSGDKFERKTYLCNRVKRRRNGQINAGVRHGIKKMRRNKQSVAVKTALNIIKKFKSENNQKHNISNEQLSKMDDILKSIDFQNKNFQKPDPIENLASNDSVEEVESFSDDEILSSSDCRKRVRSPSPDPNRKFFKSSRTKSVVTINKNIKLQVDTGKISLIEKAKNKRRKLNNAFNVSTDFNEDAEPSVSIDTILSSLDDNKENFRDNVENKSVNVLSQNSFNKNILAESINQTSSSKTQNYTPTQSKIQTLNEHKSNNIKEALLSPTSQMCDMASELALNSPKKGVLNINKAFNIDLTENQINSANSDLDMEQKKLFPIFYTSHRVQKLRDDTSMSTVPNAKKFRALDKNQMLLDAGQKRWGATLCGECHIVYHMGDPGDEIMHQNFHNAINVFKFQGWKHEDVITTTPEGRIIRVKPGDAKIWWKKVKDLLDVINRDLGYYEMDVNYANTHVFLYIKNKKIVGCIAAEPRATGHRMLSNSGLDLCSETCYPVKCGISRIWVSQENRKQGIATALMNSVRTHFKLGQILSNNDIALSSPTELGKIFATKYFQTSNYLIYM